MERISEEVLEALDVSANTVSELAHDLGISWPEAERAVEQCVRRGWVVPPLPAAGSPMPGGLSSYLMLTVEGEDALGEMGATEQ